MPDDEGVLFPADSDGRRSTMATNRAIWADAARAVDTELADRSASSGNWRRDYIPHVRAVTEAGARSADVARAIARAGLASARERMVFRRAGVDHPLTGACSVTPAVTFATETIQGHAEPLRELIVPFRGQQLRGDALRAQIDRWERGGIIEPSAAAALLAVLAKPDWLALPGRQVVVLGAGAETSPLPVLAAWGADVIAVDLPRADLWRRLFDTARAGAGRVRLPVRPGDTDAADRAGADLITELPETAAWLAGLTGRLPVVLGFYVYADGALHVQATAAADAMATAVQATGIDVTVAYAGTPSDCYLVPPEVIRDSDVRRRSRGVRRPFELAVRGVSADRLYAPAYPNVRHGEDGLDWGVADALVTQQGPNYALAKRLQRWRAISAWTDGRRASFNVAPPTWTRSVTKNRLLAAGYHGAHLAGMEVFEPDTMRTVMTALLVHDMYADTEAEGSTHPELLIAREAVHGGYWRQPFEIRSTLTFTAVAGLPRAYVKALRFR